MNFQETVKKARELSFSDSLSSLFSEEQREILGETVDAMERDVGKVFAGERVEFREEDAGQVFFMLDRLSDHLRMSIGVHKEVKEFIRAYLQLSFNYTNCRRQMGHRSSLLEQVIRKLYGLARWRDAEILVSLRQRVN